MKQKVFKSGNSLTVVIPAEFAKKVGVKAGDKAVVNTNVKKASLRVVFPAPRQLRLEQ